MSLFANAAYGCIPEEKLHTQLERYIEEIMDGVLPGEDMEWDKALEKAGQMPEVRKIIRDLGFSESAILIGVQKTEDGSELDEGTLIIGWGILAFPGIAYTDGFRDTVLKGPEMQWHFWVSGG